MRPNSPYPNAISTIDVGKSVRKPNQSKIMRPLSVLFDPLAEKIGKIVKSLNSRKYLKKRALQECTRGKIG